RARLKPAGPGFVFHHTKCHNCFLALADALGQDVGPVGKSTATHCSKRFWLAPMTDFLLAALPIATILFLMIK
ncbi:MAG TPA: hypothetical protein DD982_09965, partial [Thalassospira sp.]|nr:hypothetical protein [Thalassospira sp.]